MTGRIVSNQRREQTRSTFTDRIERNSCTIGGMKANIIYRPYTFLLAIVASLLFGCAAPQASETQPLAETITYTPAPSATSIPTQTASSTPTPTQLPTASLEPATPSAPTWPAPTEPATVTPLPVLQVDPNADTLRRYASERGLLIGAAVNNGLVHENEYAALLGEQFNSLVTENSLKFGLIHPEPGRYDFTASDEIINFALAHGMKVRGHTLVWQQQMPDWLYYGEWTREQLMEVLHQHIATVVGRYRGQVYAWDVVNEGIDNYGGLSRNFWYTHIGPDYIDLAFQWAHEADPDALLFYNDFGAEAINAKSDGVYELVKGMQERGAPIDGVGMQFHLVAGSVPNAERVAANMGRIHELGLQVHITELDIRIEMPSNETKLAIQAQNYAEVLNTCLGAPNCTALILWGMTDRYSWIPSFFDGYGAALIFDEAYQPKPAYQAMLEILKTK